MSTNRELAERLLEISEMLELLGEDRFRVAANAKAARTIENLGQDVAELAKDRKKLQEIDGIGKKLADKIVQFCESGEITEHEELKGQVPAGLLEVMKIPGLGPKTVQVLWRQKGVVDVEGLRRVIDDGSILELPRMGAKTVENIKAAIAFAEHAGDRLPLGRAMPVAEAVVQKLSGVEGVDQIAFAGSLRRGRDTIGDVDILVAGSSPEGVHKAFRGLSGVDKVIAAGKTKSSIRVRAGIERGRWTGEGGPLVQVDLRTVPQESWGAALMYFTGSKAHNVKLRELAVKKGFTLNEYGLFPADDEKTPPQSRGVEPAAGNSEEEVYKKLGLPWIPPEIREDQGELALKQTPRLIEFDDILSELHAHTTESDGLMRPEELVKEAKRRGYHAIAVTDHSKSAVQANGLSAERLREHAAHVREIAGKESGIAVLAGTEVDILGNGSLDYDDELLAELDIVVASPHVALSQDPKTATKRLIKAVEHPKVNILGHPSGRLIGRRPGLSPDMGEVIAAAVEHGVALEINAHWLRLDLRDGHVRAAVEAGCLIAINCDVHTPADFDHLRYGVLTGRRGWLEPERCVNTWAVGKLQGWLKRKP